MSGTLYGLGVGPGDPDLITLKALRILETSPVIAYPAPETGPSLARAIAAPHIPVGKIEVPIRMPMVAERFPAQAIYDQKATELAVHLHAGRDVAVLCEGDPFFYGSFMYLFARLAGDFPALAVPGVSSLTACAASLGAPLTARNDVLTVIPAPLPEAEIKARLAGTDAAAIVKVGRHLGKVKRVLEGLGLSDRARYIEHATMAGERTLTLAEASSEGSPYFSMVLVHKRGEAWA